MADEEEPEEQRQELGVQVDEVDEADGEGEEGEGVWEG